MRPESLEYRFSWEDRHVAIYDRIWYVPNCYDQYATFCFPGWEHEDTFLHKRPIRVEYCSGNGAWIAAKALQNPHINWVAVEKQFVRARKIWSKVKNYQLDNLLIVCGEGYPVTHHYFPANSVDDIFINFPDPWPKRRHIKHRIIQPEFIEEMGRVLQVGGTLTFVTDDKDYSDWMIKMMHATANFESCYEQPFFITEFTGYGSSYFEDLWRHKGREIRYHQFRKKG